MKKFFVTVLAGALLAIGLYSFTSSPKADSLAIGAAAPMTDVKMEDAISGKSFSLEDSKMENGLLVMFTCNTCPYVIAWENRFDDLAKVCKENKIGFIAINSNEAYRGDADSKKAMKEHAADQKYGFPYVIDTNHELADAFGATRTPEMFLLNGEMKLEYKGAIDDSPRDVSAVSNKYVEMALNNLASGKDIDPNTTKSIGCSIKRLK